MSQSDWEEELELSKGDLDMLSQILMARIPGASEVEIADTSDDKRGADLWVSIGGSPRKLAVDVKLRKVDAMKWGKDDLALETWSVCYSKVGWTLDWTKNTDYVLWYWRPTKRFFLAPFPPLCKVFRSYREKWKQQFGVQPQRSRNKKGQSWESECVFVPRALLTKKLNDWAYGYLEAEDGTD